ncbi:hypothetical protein GGI21_002061, partial [Coemansia aciculifera]
THQIRPGPNEVHEFRQSRADRHTSLEKTLEELEEQSVFDVLLCLTNLKADYDAYVGAVGDVFALVIDKVPTVDSATNESTYSEGFISVVDVLSDQAEASGLPDQYANTAYDVLDTQSKRKDPSNLQPDIIISTGGSIYSTFEDAVMFVVVKKQGSRDFYLTWISHGVLVRDIDGYRLEFILMSRCGVPMVNFIQNSLKGLVFDPSVADDAASIVRQVVSTLTEALDTKVLHRDISAGNISVKGSKAYVIDWGYAKFVDLPVDETFANRVAH